MVNLIRAYKPLQAADFTIVNLGSHAVANQCNSVAMSGGAGVGQSNITMLAKPIPATPYTVTLHAKDFQLGAAYYGYGLCFRDSVGKHIAANVCYSGGSIYSNTSRVEAYYDVNSIAGAFASGADCIWDQQWFRVKDNGTNLYFYISADGVNWFLLYTLSRATWVTPDQVGFFIDPFSAAAVVLFDSFEINEHA